MPDGDTARPAATDIFYWRERILRAIYLTAAGIGLIVYFPTAIHFLRERLWLPLTLSTLALAWSFVAVIFNRRINLSVRAAGVLACLYLLGLMSLYYLGPLSGGLIWLFAFAVLSGVLLGLGMAVAALVINTATLLVFGWLVTLQALPWLPPGGDYLTKWTILSGSMILLNVLAAISVAILGRGLQTTLQQEKNALEQLDQDRVSLKQANARLQEEIAERERVAKYMSLQRDLGLALGSTSDLNQALRDSLAAVLNVERVDSGALYLREEDGSLSLVHYHGFSPEYATVCSRFDADSFQAAIAAAGNVLHTHYDQLFPEKDDLRHREGLRALSIIPVRHQGRVVAVLSAASRLHDRFPSETITALETIATQISGTIVRLRISEALQESEQRYRSLLEDLPYGLFLAEIPSGRFLFLNRRILDLFGYTLDQGLELSFWDTTPPREHNTILNRLKARLDGDLAESDRYRYTGLRRDGGKFRFEVSLSLVNYQNRSCLQGILQDVTQIDMLEKQIQRSQKMEALGTLTSGVAHDFKNLLQAISGYLELMQHGTEPEGKLNHYLSQADRTTQRAVDLVNRLLTFSRGVETKLIPVDLNEEIRASVEVLARTIPKMIRIEARLKRELLPIQADSGQLEQLLLNLGVNAKDAMPDGGLLLMATENKILDEEFCRSHLGLKPGPHIRLTVSDTGHGMDEETIEHIFEPFYTTKEIGQGTGLGLSTVYGIVKSHQGAIFCESRPGEGTTFSLYFPALEAETPVEFKPSTVEDQRLRGSEIILLVDDERNVREVAREMLTEYGYTILTAETGEDALAVYKENLRTIGLVILDLGMPGMGGRQCLREIIKLDPQARVIISTGYANTDLQPTDLEKEARGFLNKPYRLLDLLKKVRQVLEA
ncbi:MAG: response regulator [Thermodesulfobacteriota bacterium]